MFSAQARNELEEMILFCLHNRILIQFRMLYLALHKLSIVAFRQPKIEIRPTYAIIKSSSPDLNPYPIFWGMESVSFLDKNPGLISQFITYKLYYRYYTICELKVIQVSAACFYDSWFIVNSRLDICTNSLLVDSKVPGWDVLVLNKSLFI